LTNSLQELWRTRHFIKSAVRNEFATRFARSRLGGLWMIIYPLAQIVIYAFILSAVMAARLPGIAGTYSYAIYLTAGILGWSLFTEVVSRSLGVFIDNGNLLKKMAFPRLALPVILAGSCLINNLLLLLVSLAVFACLGHWPGMSIFWLPLLTLLTLFLALGLGLSLGIINVFLRDVGQVIPIFIQFGFWLTPIVYVMAMIPQKFQFILYLNPMTGIIQAYQSVMVFGRMPNLMLLIYPVVFTLVMGAVAAQLYRRAGDEMVDAL
jgi:lipopolysaccharide transport system permease protein